MSEENRDRRQYTRLPKNYSVEVRAFCFPVNSQPKLTAKSADISAGGLSVELAANYCKGDKLQVKVCVPCLNKFMPGFFKVYENDAEQYLQAIAEVVRVERGASPDTRILGLRFIDLAEDSFIALKKMVEKAVRENGKQAFV